MNNRRRLVPFRGDRSLWIIISAMLVISLLVVYSSTVSMAHKEVGGDTSYFVLRQAKFIIFSFIVMFFIHWINFKTYAKYTRTIFYLSVILVIVAMFIGESRNDATRWIPVPFIGRFQPSEMLKISLMALLAVQLGKRSSILSKIPLLPSLTARGWRENPQRNIRIWDEITKPMVMPIAIACLVILPMNLSTSVILFVVSLIVFAVARIRTREILKILLLTVVIFATIFTIMYAFNIGRAQTWANRIENFAAPILGNDSDNTKIDKDENFQKKQAKIAIASGGVMGKGPGNSTQRSQLPHPYSDFAYAFIIEEYGLWGATITFMLYLWIFYRCGVIMRRCRSTTNALLVLGLGLSIAVQAFVNMLVCVGLAPVTGQPLPLISMGGSSVLFTSIAFGMILSVSRQNDAEDQAEARLLALENAPMGDNNGDFLYPDSEKIITPNDETEYDSDDYHRYDRSGKNDAYDDYNDSDDDDYEYNDDDDDEYANGYSGNKTMNNDQGEDDDFPFTLVDRNDSTKTNDSKQERSTTNLYDD